MLDKNNIILLYIKKYDTGRQRWDNLRKPLLYKWDV